MRILYLLTIAFLSVNGFAMLAAPETWYENVPGAADTSPMNVHFIRDIGIVYLLLLLDSCGAAWMVLEAGLPQ